MGIDSDVERLKPSSNASVEFGSTRRHAPEAAEIARAIAVKLGHDRVALIGCVREPIVSALTASLDVVGIDAESFVSRARELDPRGCWVKLGSPGKPFGSDARAVLANSLLMVDARLVLDNRAFLRHLCDAIGELPATLLIDPDGGIGMEAVGPLVTDAEDAGLIVVHRCLLRSHQRGVWRRESPMVVVSSTRDPALNYVLSAGAKGLALDSCVDMDTKLDRPARICVASYEVAGPTRNGGIGTANTSLALALARAGHDVTLMFTGSPESDGPVDARRWERHYARENIRFAALGVKTISRIKSPHANVRRAYELYEWLQEHEGGGSFDVVHFPECQGHGYYAVLARAQGLAFHNTLFVAGVHSSTRWCAEANRELPRSIDALVDDHLERVSVELADVVISPSAYMFDYLDDRGWKLPARRFVQQYIIPPIARLRPEVANRRRERPIEEIVFFGRLEVRKGIETFCDALDLVAESAARRHLRITFLGQPEHVFGEPAIEYVARRASRWPWTHQVLGALEQPKAIAYLRRHSCLAVMPSTVDNSPNTVSEAVSLRIPMIATRSGGTGELIDPLDLPGATFPGLEPERGVPPTPAGLVAPEVSAQALAERILASLSSAVIPRFAIDQEANENIHVRWNVGAIAEMHNRRGMKLGLASSRPLPRVTVGILHRDQPDGLLPALTAVAEQQEQLADVVVIDDASRTDPAMRAFALAEDICRRSGWKAIRRERRHAGAARNQMLADGSGDLFVFLRSSEMLAPHALATIREAARRTGVDIFSWPTANRRRRYHEAAGDSPSALSEGPIVVPIGGPPLAGLLYQAFSSGPYAITRDALDRIHGFSRDARDLEADRDLINRGLLHGCSMMVIPQPLTIAQEGDSWQRIWTALPIQLGEPELDREQALRIARPFAVIAPSQVTDLPGLHLTLHSDLPGERARALEAYGELDDRRHQQAEYIAYLEKEHHALSATVHALRATIDGAPHRRARRIGGRLKRRLMRAIR